MDLVLSRTETTRDAIFGELAIDSIPFCVTLENRDLCIPMGTYSIELTYSPHFGRVLPLVDGVPDRTAIRLHAGNVAADSEGCILVASRRNGDMVLDSRVALDKLLDKIQKAIHAGEVVSLRIV